MRRLREKKRNRKKTRGFRRNEEEKNEVKHARMLENYHNHHRWRRRRHLKLQTNPCCHTYIQYCSKLSPLRSHKTM